MICSGTNPGDPGIKHVLEANECNWAFGRVEVKPDHDGDDEPHTLDCLRPRAMFCIPKEPLHHDLTTISETRE